MRLHDKVGERQRMRGSAHILFHQPHADRALDIEPARIEHHALANNGDAWVAFVTPFKLNQPWRIVARRRHADSVDQRIAGLQFMPLSDMQFTFVGLGEPCRFGLQLLRPKIDGRAVDHVPHQRRRLCLTNGIFNPPRLARQQDARALQLGFAAIFVKAILP